MNRMPMAVQAASAGPAPSWSVPLIVHTVWRWMNTHAQYADVKVRTKHAHSSVAPNTVQQDTRMMLLAASCASVRLSLITVHRPAIAVRSVHMDLKQIVVQVVKSVRASLLWSAPWRHATCSAHMDESATPWGVRCVSVSGLDVQRQTVI